MGGRGVLVETSTIEADHDPGVWEERVWLLKGFYVFESIQILVLGSMFG